MGMDDLSYLEQLMGGASGESDGTRGGVWVVSPDGQLDDGLMRLVGQARVVANALGAYVPLLLAGAGENAQQAIQAGADQVFLARGVPSVNDLAEFFRPRARRRYSSPVRDRDACWGRAWLRCWVAACAATRPPWPSTQFTGASWPISRSSTTPPAR